jgi:hypothetical protein
MKTLYGALYFATNNADKYSIIVLFSYVLTILTGALEIKGNYRELFLLNLKMSFFFLSRGLSFKLNSYLM